jgi:hypothetical protein
MNEGVTDVQIKKIQVSCSITPLFAAFGNQCRCEPEPR